MAYALVLLAVYAAALTILHFANPCPLIQIPDRGHRLFVVPADKHDIIARGLNNAGLRRYRTFNAGGIRQTLMADGYTVIASGPTITGGAVSLVSKDPSESAAGLQLYLRAYGIETDIRRPPDLDGKLVVVALPLGFGLSEVAFRLPGAKMPSPNWE
jgi:hypothetical protein